MSRRVSVVVPVHELGPWLTGLVHSLDAQTLPVDAFETVFVVPDLSGPVAARLRDLADHRPNVRVDAAAIPDGGGTWTVHLGESPAEHEPRLFPEALQRLADFGDQHDCGVVLGRATYGTGLVADDFLRSDRVLDGPIPITESTRALRLRRSDGVANDKVGLVGSYPCVRLATAPAGGGAGPPSVDERRAEWVAGRVVITVEGAADTAVGDATVALAVRHMRTGAEFWLPTRDAVVADGRFRAVADIDVRTAAAGAALDDGPWQLLVGLHADGWGQLQRAPVPPTPLPPGIVDGRPVVPFTAARGIVLDVGATRTPLLSKLRAEGATVAESAQGTRLTLPLEDLAVTGQVRLRGRLLLGKFPLPAEVIGEGGHARLECLLSGLPGTSRLFMKFGNAPAAPTGLTLTISPVGTMTVAPTPRRRPVATPPARKPAPTAAERARMAAARRRRRLARSPVSRLRRKVPPWLEPAVQLVARSRTAKRVYGRAVRRTAPEPKR